MSAYKDKREKLTAAVLTLIVISVAYLYFKYPDLLTIIGQSVIILAPMIVLFVVGGLILSRDVYRVKKSKINLEYRGTIDVNWGMSLKHDLITFVVPVIILLWPIFHDRIPNVSDLVQAGIAFVAFSYLKFLYWKSL